MLAEFYTKLPKNSRQHTDSLLFLNKYADKTKEHFGIDSAYVLPLLNFLIHGGSQ